MHHLDSWIKRDQLDVTCFIISLFNAQHVSNFSTSILRNLRLICWVILWVVLLWFDVCWCYGVVRLGWCGIRKQAEALVPPQIVFIFLCYWNRWRWKCDGVWGPCWIGFTVSDYSDLILIWIKKSSNTHALSIQLSSDKRHTFRHESDDGHSLLHGAIWWVVWLAGHPEF